MGWAATCYLTFLKSPLIDVPWRWKSLVLMEVKIPRRQRRWKLHLKIISNSRSFKLHSVYPSLLTLTIVDELSEIWIPKNSIQLQSEKKIHLHLFASAALGVSLVPTVMQMRCIVWEPSDWFRWGTMVRKSEVIGNGRKSSEKFDSRKSSEHKGRTFELLLYTSQTWSYMCKRRSQPRHVGLSLHSAHGQSRTHA